MGNRDTEMQGIVDNQSALTPDEQERAESLITEVDRIVETMDKRMLATMFVTMREVFANSDPFGYLAYRDTVMGIVESRKRK